jgi:hypothetical protein
MGILEVTLDRKGLPVRKVTACILLMLLGFALSVPATARTSANSQQRAAQKRQKKMLKQQKKQHKQDMKSSQKATKEWRKHHSSSF